jgi:hypothetical protein
LGGDIHSSLCVGDVVMVSFSFGGGGIMVCDFALSSGGVLRGAPLPPAPFIDTTMVGCSFSLTAVNRELGDSARGTLGSSPGFISRSSALTETLPSRPVLFKISLARCTKFWGPWGLS